MFQNHSKIAKKSTKLWKMFCKRAHISMNTTLRAHYLWKYVHLHIISQNTNIWWIIFRKLWIQLPVHTIPNCITLAKDCTCVQKNWCCNMFWVHNPNTTKSYKNYLQNMQHVVLRNHPTLSICTERPRLASGRFWVRATVKGVVLRKNHFLNKCS